MDLPRFTMIAATTRRGRITLPLRERFGFSPGSTTTTPTTSPRSCSQRRHPGRRDRYGRGAEIARRARGTPRIANRLLRRVRDVAEVRHDGAITGDIARAGLEMFEVDGEGLDRLDHAVLRAVIDRFTGGPVGLSTLSAAVGEEPDTVEDVVEPYLLQLASSNGPRAVAWRRLGRTRTSA
jgi:Holliday junction DNA helicase RuvB